MSVPISPTVAALREALAPAGMDLIAPMQVGWYNAAEPPGIRLPEPRGPGSLAVVLGNSRALWRPFLQGLRAAPELLEGEHPLDTWVERRVMEAVARLDARPRSIHWVNGPGSRSFSMQRAAVATGLVGMAPCHLGIHRTLGLWFGLRAVLIFDLEGPARARGSDPFPCATCAERPCVPLLERALGGPVEGAQPPPFLGVRANWTPWLALRDACPHGRQHRYGDLQIAYHYSKQRRYLLEALALTTG
jgi:methylmalonic aciduria homocystinuria type C protein